MNNSVFGEYLHRSAKTITDFMKQLSEEDDRIQNELYEMKTQVLKSIEAQLQSWMDSTKIEMFGDQMSTLDHNIVDIKKIEELLEPKILFWKMKVNDLIKIRNKLSFRRDHLRDEIFLFGGTVETFVPCTNSNMEYLRDVRMEVGLLEVRLTNIQLIMELKTKNEANFDKKNIIKLDSKPESTTALRAAILEASAYKIKHEVDLEEFQKWRYLKNMYSECQIDRNFEALIDGVPCTLEDVKDKIVLAEEVLVRTETKFFGKTFVNLLKAEANKMKNEMDRSPGEMILDLTFLGTEEANKVGKGRGRSLRQRQRHVTQ